MWPFRRRRIRKLNQPSLAFLGAQDGELERELKERVEPLLAGCSAVERAYLAIVTYDDPSKTAVALCVRGPEDPALAQRIGRVFAELFASGVSMDIMFVDETKEEGVAAVCRPFYEAV
jgi:hypothetical protein